MTREEAIKKLARAAILKARELAPHSNFVLGGWNEAIASIYIQALVTAMWDSGLITVEWKGDDL